MPPIVRVASDLSADASEGWERATTPEGINYELRPVLRMTVPRGARGLTLKDVTPGSRLGRSWIFLLGLVPVEYDDLFIAEVGPNRFLERSSMLTLKLWQHERSVRPTRSGCSVEDILTFEPRAALARIPGVERLIATAISALFRHRHRRLKRRYGAQRSQ